MLNLSIIKVCYQFGGKFPSFTRCLLMKVKKTCFCFCFFSDIQQELIDYECIGSVYYVELALSRN